MSFWHHISVNSRNFKYLNFQTLWPFWDILRPEDTKVGSMHCLNINFELYEKQWTSSSDVEMVGYFKLFRAVFLFFYDFFLEKFIIAEICRHTSSGVPKLFELFHCFTFRIVPPPDLRGSNVASLWSL